MGAARERGLAQSRRGTCLGAWPPREELEETPARRQGRRRERRGAVGAQKAGEPIRPTIHGPCLGRGEAARVRRFERLWASGPTRAWPQGRAALSSVDS